MPKGEAFRRAQLAMLGAENVEMSNDSGALRSELVGVKGKKSDLPLFEKDEKNPFAHPHFWAAFVLIGNWR